MEKETKKEIGKWLMDIAKYLLTAVFFTSIFKEVSQRWLAAISALVVIVVFCVGVILYNRNSKK